MLLIARNPLLTDGLRDEFVDLWVRVTNAGGAVGFVPPVTAEDVRPMAKEALDRVRAGLDDLAVAWLEDEVVGFGFLVANEWPLYLPWATIKRLQRHPGWEAVGIGSRVLLELEQAGRDRGYERAVLSVRGGTGLERFYLRRGYRVDGRLPRRIQVAADDVREELVMSKVLRGEPDPPSPAPLALEVKRLDPDLPLPAYAHEGDAGLDLHARDDVLLPPGERAVVATGLAVAIPAGCVGLVHPRSGLAARHGLSLVNAPGTIDSGYRGEVRLVLVNLDPAVAARVRRGDRVAQLVVQRVETVSVVEVGELPETARGARGFGSSGA